MKIFKDKIMLLVIALFALLLVSGCAGMAKSAAAPEAGKVTGTWVGSGSDDRGVEWDFTFVLKQNGKKLTGTSVWQGSDGAAATSDMEGTVDSVNGAFTLVDTSIGGVSGDVDVATYSGSFDPEFNKMAGTWVTAINKSEGEFKASRK